MTEKEPKGIISDLTGARKRYFDRLAAERNKIADKRMTMNRLPNAASGYKDFPNNRK